MAGTTTSPKTYTKEEMDYEVKRQVEAEKKKLEKANAGYQIMAPLADPNHKMWQPSIQNPDNKFNADTVKTVGTFELSIHKHTTRDGELFEGEYLLFYNGKAFTQSKAIADWIKVYHPDYTVTESKPKGDFDKLQTLGKD